MLIIERVVALRGAPVFADLPDHVVARVAAVVREETIEAGRTIVEQGADESWMYVLVDGAATAAVGGTTVATLERGAMIGELAALDPQPRSATVTATESCLLFRIDHDALLEVMVDQPEVGQAIITMLARRLRATNEALATGR
ncbi:MAG: cyclic nucleotide-binding domain-containing protein [Actinomycetota bacterium]